MASNTDELKEQERTSWEDAGSNRWLGGLILIAIGVIFLLGNVVDIRINNWWALFILIPVVAAWGNAWRLTQAAGHVTVEARQAFAGALFPLYVALIFLFNWDWGQVWPGFLIIAGINAVMGGWMGDK